jgi:mannose-6-phosphate isomerase-like protein (cupin superfamily)
MRVVWIACSLAVFCAVPVAAQDPVKVAPGSYKLVAENQRVRVLHATLAPGSKVPMHEHPAHVGVVLTGGTIAMTTPDGKTTNIEAKAEEALLMPAGGHAMANPGKAPIEVVVIEMKGAPGSATIPSSRPGMKMTPILKDARVEAWRITVDPSFKEPAGTTHEFDQVVVPLASADVNLTVDGKKITSWTRGEARLIGRGVPHESAGGKAPADVIIVSIK